MLSETLLAHGAPVLAVTALLALAFKVIQRRHSRYSGQDWMVSGALVAFALGWGIVVPDIAGLCVAVAGPQAPQILHLVVLFAQVYCVAGFMLLATDARRGLWLLSIGAVLAASGLGVLTGFGALARPPGALPAQPAAVMLNALIPAYTASASQLRPRWRGVTPDRHADRSARRYA